MEHVDIPETLRNNYYNKLLNDFGFIELKGTKILATVLALYDYQTKIKDLIDEVAIMYNSTPAACERSIRTFLNKVNKKFTMDELSEKFNYSFNNAHLVPSEFIPVLIRAYNN